MQMKIERLTGRLSAQRRSLVRDSCVREALLESDLDLLDGRGQRAPDEEDTGIWWPVVLCKPCEVHRVVAGSLRLSQRVLHDF